jgi:superfamily I DNA and/or RNA helicase
VPRESVSIITPYKGQKNAIQKALQKAGVLKPPKRDDRGRLEFDDGMVVSTVDRYQGDENDIVILSLVRTRPGNRFVALHNRFVVAT